MSLVDLVRLPESLASKGRDRFCFHMDWDHADCQGALFFAANERDGSDALFLSLIALYHLKLPGNTGHFFAKNPQIQ